MALRIFNVRLRVNITESNLSPWSITATTLTRKKKKNCKIFAKAQTSFSTSIQSTDFKFCQSVVIKVVKIRGKYPCLNWQEKSTSAQVSVCH